MNIHDYLIEKGVFPNLIGFNYLIKAVNLIKEKGRLSITKELYPLIAKEYKTSSTKVERAIRSIVTNKLTMKDFASIGLNKRPSNSEFIYFFANLGGKNGK